MPKELTLKQAADEIRNLPTKIAVEAATRVLNEESGGLKDEIMTALRATSIAKAMAGQQVFSKGAKGNRVKKRKPIKQIFATVYTRGEYQGKPALIVRAYGIAAMLEEGGRTKGHDIFPSGKFVKQLRGKAKERLSGAQALTSGGGIFSAGHWHPGSTIRPHRLIQKAMEAARDRIAKNLDAAIQAAIDKSPLG